MTSRKKHRSDQDGNNREQFRILESAHRQILDTVGRRRPESGGILLGSRNDYVVQKFVFDAGGSMSSAAYDPDVVFINRTIKKEWNDNGLAFLGFIHSHPRGVSRLSGDWGNNTGDVGYMRAIFKAIPALKKFLVPIMFSPADGGELIIFPYIAYRDREHEYFAGEYTIIKDSQYQAPVIKVDPVSQEFNSQRLEGSVDTRLMRDAKVVCVGIGGANGICESLVRSGLGHIVLVDFDNVDSNNLVTQGYYIDDIGKPKVDVLKERLLNINRQLKVETFNRDFTEIPDGDMKAIMDGTDLILMMTDSFHAQARGNIIGLRHQVPTVFAMVYELARCAEITFMIPGVTPACHRCAVSDRYNAYLKKGYQNKVTSTGSTHFHTTYLNGAIGLLALSILHRRTRGVEFGGWFGSKWDRNLIQLRMSPFYDSPLFARTFEGIERVYCMDSVWQRIEPERPPKYENCPDCGGQGNLKKAAELHQW
jgi:hypothetical protein